MTANTPRTAAGRQLLDSLPPEWHPINTDIMREHILAIEAERAAPTSAAEPLDVERLAKAIATVYGWAPSLRDTEADKIAAEYNRYLEAEAPPEPLTLVEALERIQAYKEWLKEALAAARPEAER
jgi:hypothetical protein